MDNGLLPRRYAKALYKFAVEKDAAEHLYTVMQKLEHAFDSNSDLLGTIANPFVDEKSKLELVATAVGGKDDILDNFVRLLIANNRIDILRNATLAYLQLYRQQNRIHLVNITSAAPLNDADRKRIVDMIEKHIKGDKAEFTFDVNPDLIGGFIVRIDNESLDATVLNELNQLRRNLIK